MFNLTPKFNPLFISLVLITEELTHNISTKVTKCNNKQTNGRLLHIETSTGAKIQLTDYHFFLSIVFIAVSNKTEIASG